MKVEWLAEWSGEDIVRHIGGATKALRAADCTPKDLVVRDSDRHDGAPKSRCSRVSIRPHSASNPPCQPNPSPGSGAAAKPTRPCWPTTPPATIHRPQPLT